MPGQCPCRRLILHAAFILYSILARWAIIEQQQKAGSLASFCPSISVYSEFPVIGTKDRERGKWLEDKEEEEKDEEVISVCE